MVNFHRLSENERLLLRMVQRRMLAVRDNGPGNKAGVYSLGDAEIGKEGDLIGYLPRKLIPFRRVEQREARHAEKLRLEREDAERKFELELEKGIDVLFSRETPFPRLEKRYNIHPGKVYRIIYISGNPMYELRYDGILTKLNAYCNSEGFTLEDAELIDGIVRDTCCMTLETFDKHVHRRENGPFLGFGRILDEEGFRKARERIKTNGEKNA